MLSILLFSCVFLVCQGGKHSHPLTNVEGCIFLRNFIYFNDLFLKETGTFNANCIETWTFFVYNCIITANLKERTSY